MARACFHGTGRAASGLAALEALLLLVIAAAGLALLAGQAEAVRDRLRQELASRQLAALREALTVYYLDTGTFPAGAADLSATDAFRRLRSSLPAGTVPADWPQAPREPGRDDPLDPWRRTYRYIGPGNDSAAQPADNGGWPLFVSAGPDGDFGGPGNPGAEVDNRRTDELLPD